MVSAGEASAPISSAGVRKMPTAIVWPTTSAVANHSPTAAAGDGSEADTSSELQGKRSARTEHAPSRGDRYSECRGPEIPGAGGIVGIADERIREPGVVQRGGAEDVRHVEHVEHLHQPVDAQRSCRERFRQPQVQRIEAVV